ncbi:hypothetical protein EN851_03350 [Mesorhizobium sp. M8A.F.Ca.ET.208.01.1.1]|nr:hypothetical protein EN851_03350 [Mesorhizobium sp. M8A.F.Ca.ET.208.01.1.1]TGT55093.1 hypothetical protein EN810_03350 [Mesorhizobium sp. M8A.F.Ca.ET.167.01.1.1]
MKADNDNSPLYLSEEAIAQRVLGTRAKARWTAIAAVWEREGLPRIDPVIGYRYWPAVRSFLDRRHGLHQTHLPSAADGLENWN